MLLIVIIDTLNISRRTPSQDNEIGYAAGKNKRGLNVWLKQPIASIAAKINKVKVER